MTEFETQVTKALHDLLVQAKCPDGFAQPSHWERAAHIAPRVAAAIRASSREAVAYTGARELMDQAAEWAEECALAALRNEP